MEIAFRLFNRKLSVHRAAAGMAALLLIAGVSGCGGHSNVNVNGEFHGDFTSGSSDSSSGGISNGTSTSTANDSPETTYTGTFYDNSGHPSTLDGATVSSDGALTGTATDLVTGEQGTAYGSVSDDGSFTVIVSYPSGTAEGDGTLD